MQFVDVPKPREGWRTAPVLNAQALRALRDAVSPLRLCSKPEHPPDRAGRPATPTKPGATAPEDAGRRDGRRRPGSLPRSPDSPRRPASTLGADTEGVQFLNTDHPCGPALGPPPENLAAAESAQTRPQSRRPPGLRGRFRSWNIPPGSPPHNFCAPSTTPGDHDAAGIPCAATRSGQPPEPESLVPHLIP